MQLFAAWFALALGLFFPIEHNARSGGRWLASSDNLRPAILPLGGALGSRDGLRGLPYYDEKQKLFHVLVERKNVDGQWKVFERWIVDGDFIQVLRAQR